MVGGSDCGWPHPKGVTRGSAWGAEHRDGAQESSHSPHAHHKQVGEGFRAKKSVRGGQRRNQQRRADGEARAPLTARGASTTPPHALVHRRSARRCVPGTSDTAQAAGNSDTCGGAARLRSCDTLPERLREGLTGCQESRGRSCAAKKALKGAQSPHKAAAGGGAQRVLERLSFSLAC